MCPIEEPIVVNPPEELDIQTPSIGSVEGTRETAEPVVRNSGSESIVNPILVKEVKYLINEAILGLLPKLGFRIQKVDALPATGENGVIYLVPAEGATSPNIYEEYYWVADDNSFELIGTNEIDLSDYATLNTEQTFTAPKYTDSLFPRTTGRNIGSSTGRYATLFANNGSFAQNVTINGKLISGENSVTVADISNGLFNVINATDIVNNTLTQAQYDLITNRKPTLIKGANQSLTDILCISGTLSNANEFRGPFIAHNQFGQTYIGTYVINTSKVIAYNKTVYVGPTGQFTISNLGNLNNKTFPAYPSDTGTFVLKCVDGVLTWVQE